MTVTEKIVEALKLAEHLKDEVEVVALHDPEYGDCTDIGLVLADLRALAAAEPSEPVELERLAIRIGENGFMPYAYTEADDDGDYVTYTGALAAIRAATPTPAPADRGAVDCRALAVEIVDGIRGYTFEFSSHPDAHREDYDFVEGRLIAALALPAAEGVKSLRDRDDIWAMFYRDGKSLGEICEAVGCGVYDLSPWLTAPLIRAALAAPSQAREG